MNKICKHCEKEDLEVVKDQLVIGDRTCCGEEIKTVHECRKEGHVVYICHGKHYGLEGDEIGPIIFKHENG